MVNQLPATKQTKILYQLLEGNGMRSICRMEDVSWRTVEKLQTDAARVARRYHRRHVSDLDVESIQIDELWSFCYAKQHRLKKLNSHPDDAGDVWTWLALESDTKLILAYRVDDRTYHSCKRFIKDLEGRVNYDRDLEIFTDGNPTYPKAIKRYFGTKISYSQLVKVHKGDEVEIEDRQVYGKRRSNRSTTSYIERCNLTVRQATRRYARKTNGFSKTIENHRASFDLFVMYYNWIRTHETLGTVPAVAAGIADQPYSLERLVRRVDRLRRRGRERNRDRCQLAIK